MSRERDNKRSQVYAAEDLSAELTTLTDQRPLNELQQIVHEVCASTWWQQNFKAGVIRVLANRSDRQSYFTVATRTIALSAQSMDLNTLCHELAHVGWFDLGSVGPVHGSRFRALHVSVRGAICGPQSAQDLEEVYGQFGLLVESLHGREWPEGPSVLDPALYESVRILGRPVRDKKLFSHRGPIAL